MKRRGSLWGSRRNRAGKNYDVANMVHAYEDVYEDLLAHSQLGMCGVCSEGRRFRPKKRLAVSIGELSERRMERT